LAQDGFAGQAAEKMNQSTRLPPVDGRPAYEALHPDTARWLPAMHELCHRHGLDAQRLQRLPEGTNIVFAAGDAILKLYPPHWARLAATERAVAERVYGRLSVATPEVYAAGNLEGWPYLVMSRLPGRSLHEVWLGLSADEQRCLVIEIGGLLTQLHTLDTAGLDDVDADWAGFIDERIRSCVSRQRAHGAPETWLEQIPPFLSSTSPLYPPGFRPAIISGDVHDYHLQVEERNGTWRLCGLFDFDDARLGFREYDLATPALFLMSGRADLLRAFLDAYGIAPEALDPGLSHRLFAYTLLHGYWGLPWMLEEFAGGAPTTLEDLAGTIFALRQA
jgi:hygromycin-B 7''-O-kinase